MSKIDRILQSAKVLSEQMKLSQESFEQHEVEKNYPISHSKAYLTLTMNGKYETSVIISNPNQESIDPYVLTETLLVAQQSAVSDLQNYTKIQMQSVAKALNDSTSHPLDSE